MARRSDSDRRCGSSAIQGWRGVTVPVGIPEDMPEIDLLAYRTAICARIAAARTAARLTQIQVAEAIGTTDRAVRAWERDGALPAAEVFGLLAPVLGVTVEYLIGRPNGMPVPLIDTRIEALILALPANDGDLPEHLSQLGTFATETLQSCETVGRWRTRVTRVWTHAERILKLPGAPRTEGKRDEGKQPRKGRPGRPKA